MEPVVLHALHAAQYFFTGKDISCQMALISLQLVVGNVPEKGNANQDGIRIIEIMNSESKIDVAK